MRFALSAEHQQFAATLHDLLTDTDVTVIARNWAAGDATDGRKLLRQLGDLGVLGLTVPDRWDGLSATPVDLVVAFEELGYFAVPGPLVESVAVVPALLTTLGADELCTRWLPGIASGDRPVTYLAPPRIPYALDADVAEVLIVRRDQLQLGTPEDVPLSTIDESRRLFRVRFGDVLHSGPEVERAADVAFDYGVLAAAAQLLGLGRGLLDRSTEYVRQRHQFGRPIGQFQAVKHQLADVLVALELARPLLHGAAIALGAGAATAARDVSAARVACADAAYRAARTGLQVHGAIGYTQEYELGRWLTKVRALRSAWGTQSAHRARVLAALTGEGTCN